MQIRYYKDPGSGQPHIYSHNVAEYEVEAVLEKEERELRSGKRMRVVTCESYRFRIPFRIRFL